MAIERGEMLAEFEREYRELKGTTRSVRPADRLEEDLGIDSLIAQELLAALEDRYELDLIGDGRLMKVRTVDDLLDVLEEVQRTVQGPS